MSRQAVTTILPTPALWKRFVLVAAGALLMAVNLSTFVYTGSLFPGGFSGLSLLLQRTALKYLSIEIPYSLLYLLMNAFPVYISLRFIGKRFTLFSILMIVLSSVLSDLIPSYQVTDDVLLCAVFGGLLNGLSVVLCLYGDATSGGTDFIAIYFATRKGKDMWNFIFAGNCCVLAVAGLLFGWTSALYSIIFQFTSTQVLNMLYHRYQKSTMLIVTEHPNDVYRVIHDDTNHDATKIQVVGCYRNAEKTMVYTVVGGDQTKALASHLRRVDPTAFINVLQSKEILGKFFTRPAD